jgi:RNA polymerase sigma-B factor
MPLLDRLVDPVLTTGERSRIRAEVITGFMPVAEHIARKFVGRGQPYDDLRQVALLGLIGAVDRFDSGRGTNFIAFAVPTITGELKRHFRDTSWAVHVPRRLKELHRAIRKASDELVHELGRAPRPSDVAARLGIPVGDVYEGMQVGVVMGADSLEEATEESRSFDRQSGQLDRDLELVEERVSLYPALARLPERDAVVVVLRFFEGLTQTQIAGRVGVSQMQVSRVLTHSLAVLREAIAESPGPTEHRILPATGGGTPGDDDPRSATTP